MRAFLTRLTLVAALAAGAAVGIAGPAGADATLDGLNRQIMADPRDIAANLAYARHAESLGEWRKALVAYERVMMLEPGNAEASAGYGRVRFRLQPTFTTLTLEGGFYGVTDSRSRTGFPTGESALVGFAGAALRNETVLFDTRWRTRARLYSEWEGEATYDALRFASIDTGPVVPISPVWSLYLGPTAGIAYSDTSYAFAEAGAVAVLDGRLNGATQAIELKVAWRDYGNRFLAGSAVMVDLSGRFNLPGLLVDTDVLTIQPRLRWSNGPVAGTVYNLTNPGGFVSSTDTTIASLRFDYSVPLVEDVTLTPNVAVRYAIYEIDARPAQVVNNPSPLTNREFGLTPGVRLTWSNLFRQGFDVSFDYNYDWVHGRNQFYAGGSPNDRRNVQLEYGSHLFGMRASLRY